MNYAKKLKIEPGSKIRLSEIDPGYTGEYDSQELAQPEIEKHLERLTELQFRMFAEQKHGLLVVLQAIDAGGKDGTIKHVFGAMNPQGCRVKGFKAPTAEELAHDFLWRVHPHVPARGEVAIFNRSHYEDVLVVRVHNLAPREVWSQRYDMINEFEKGLAAAGVTILKFFLYIDKDEQLKRFGDRLMDPSKNWKISDSDYTDREFFDDYLAAFEDAISKTSTDYAPWFVIPSNKKWFRNLAVSQIIADAMEDLKMQVPAPTVDLSQIRRLYHAEVVEEKSNHG
jgi:PPK2 family polyphosphate:nucleotide phosphotransferase